VIRKRLAVLLLALLPLGCGEEPTAAAPPPPRELTREAVGHYDQMTVLDHAGPKAQILLESREEPVWFSSVRDALAFTMLPEEPKDVAAVYVTDMGRAKSWEDPGPGVWIDAKKAFYVIGSARRGGMGAEEPVPFGDEAAARAFAQAHGGKVVAFADVPQDYVLGETAEAADVGEGQDADDAGAAAPATGPHAPQDASGHAHQGSQP
jgi:copper chaperone NosL